nr:hypothetical protein BaRGS_033328 [Batillaria attramentaria]
MDPVIMEQDGLDRPVDESECEQPKPLVSQACDTPCNRDCSVSHWGEWSRCENGACSTDNYDYILKRKKRAEGQAGKRFRKRDILTYPGPGGKSCPHLIINLGKAGCVESEKPSSVKSDCLVECPVDCHVTDWSEWSDCGTTCLAFTGESKIIPECKNKNRFPLDEQEDCKCDSLRPVVIGDWSDCILQPPDEVGEKFAQMSLKSLQLRTTNETGDSNAPNQMYCGKGIKYMAISCQTSSRDMEGAASCSASDIRHDHDDDDFHGDDDDDNDDYDEEMMMMMTTTTTTTMMMMMMMMMMMIMMMTT